MAKYGLCEKHVAFHRLYGGVYRCKYCVLEDKKERRDSRRLFWVMRYPKTRNLLKGQELHHGIENPVVDFIFERFPALKGYGKQGIFNRMQDANYSLKQDIMFRIELAMCKPMEIAAHRKLHRTHPRLNNRRKRFYGK